MQPLTSRVLALADQPYDTYNDALRQIKGALGPDGTEAFERVLAEELPWTTARRAFRTACMVAAGEKDVPRECRGWRPERGRPKRSDDGRQ